MIKEILTKKITLKKNTKISTALAWNISLLVAGSTLGIAAYAMYFLNTVFSYLVPQDELYSKLVVFQDSLQHLVFAFLIFGLVSSYYMTKIIVNPVKEMIKGTKELSDGNLSHRLTMTKYVEINDLIKTYNQMAENLQFLYTNLEKKVAERTKELENTNNELKDAQAMLVHSEKMRSLGQLVAGITHEINNPINFIHGNLTHLKKYSEALMDLINKYQTYEHELTEEEQSMLYKIKEDIELEYMAGDLPKLIKSCQEGTVRAKNIVNDLKNFSRLDEMVVNSIDLEKELDTTLNILSNKIRNKITVIKEYDKDIPHIEGFGGQLNQVFMNILDNACYAIKEKGRIFIRLKKSTNSVIIEIEDTGEGMTKEQMSKVFEPFYTTKAVGEGSGLGMSIGYKVIQNHRGTIKVNSAVGRGTIFVVQLPIKMN